jgi:hypothetical protein
MKKQQPVSLEQVREDLRTLIGAMKSVDGFRIGEAVKENVDRMASHIEAGRTAEAAEAGFEALGAGRNILGAFLRHSVIDRKPGDDGQPGKDSFFTREIGLRRDDEKFDEDIIAGLEAKCKNLEEVVRTENNGCFTQRIEAYNITKRALDSSDQEQKRRDTVRHQLSIHQKRVQNGQKDAEATARNQAAAANQRQQLLQQRKKDADDIRSLL